MALSNLEYISAISILYMHEGPSNSSIASPPNSSMLLGNTTINGLRHDHTFTPEYYYPLLIAFFLVFAVIQIAINILNSSESTRKAPNILHNTKDESILYIEGENLKYKYMSAFLFVKAAMWAKSPYTYMLYSTLHKFTMSEISVLYLIDAFLNVFSGTIMGVLADTYGRKRISMLAPINTILTIGLRLTGSKPLAYLAQVITGILGSIMSTAFESWLNKEINNIFGDDLQMKTGFRKKIFSK